MTRNPLLNACIELELAERAVLRAKEAVDTKGLKAAIARLRFAREIVLGLGGRFD